MPRRYHSRFALAGRLALCALALGACAAPTAVPPTAPPTAAPTEPATATALPPTVAATLESTPAHQGAVPATSYQLDNPYGVAFDADGNLYVSDCDPIQVSVKILKVDRFGQLIVYAGIGAGGFSGDGGPATSAQLRCPTGLAFDPAGNLYVVDTDIHRIRRIDRGGGISTVAGSGPTPPPSDPFASVDGAFGGDGGPATSARLNSPTDVACDAAGNLYIGDARNYRVRKVDQQGIITTVAGSGDAPGFSGDGGPATEARLNTASTTGDFHMGLAVDAESNLYIADIYNYRIRKVDKQGIITTVAGNGQGGFSDDGGLATAANLSYPIFVAIDNQGNLFFSEQAAAGFDSQRVRKVDKNGIITTVAGGGNRGFSGDGGPATVAALLQPAGLAFDQAGNMYIVDGGNSRVRMVDKNGIITTVVGGRP